MKYFVIYLSFKLHSLILLSIYECGNGLLVEYNQKIYLNIRHPYFYVNMLLQQLLQTRIKIVATDFLKVKSVKVNLQK